MQVSPEATEEAQEWRHVCLFSGIGGFGLTAKWAGFTTVQMVEIDPFCRAVLSKNFPGVPIHDDVTTFDGRPFFGRVHLVTGGAPCQGHSDAGAGEGMGDARSGLWYEMLRIIRAIQPTWVLFENVPGIRNKPGEREDERAADTVLRGLEEAGYACWTSVVGADDVGAAHRRKRVWIVARLAESDGQRHASDRGAGAAGLGGGDGRGAESRDDLPAAAQSGGDVPGSDERVSCVAVGQADGDGAGLALGAGLGRDDGLECAAAERSGVPLAHGDGGHDHGGGREPGWGAEPADRSSDVPQGCDLADADGPGQQQSEGGVGEEWGRDRDGSAALADSVGQCRGTERHGSDVAPRGRAARRKPRRGSGPLADAPERQNDERYPGGLAETARPGERGDSAAGPGRYPFPYPPGPQDFGAWAVVAQMDPSLMPSIERCVRRVAARLPARLDGITGSLRTNRLKALGNSIVPDVALPFLLWIRQQLEAGEGM